MTEPVKRYVTTCDCMSEAAWGDYVRHEDYARLEQECERLRNALEKIAAIEDRYNCGDWDEIEEAREIATAALSTKP